MQLIDIGVNLTSKRFSRDLDEVLRRARDVGMEAMVVTGTGVDESARALEIARREPGFLYATAGVHPHVARHLDAGGLKQLRDLLAEPEVVAAGETGLDFNRDFSPRPQQESAFEAQLELAATTGKPVFIHQRDAHDRLHAILRHYRDAIADAVIHCFTDDRRALFAYLDMDLHIGITGWICDERRGQGLRELVGEIPAQRLMIETDAPYLLPKDISPAPPGGRNEPAYLINVLAAVARYRGEDPKSLAAVTTANARRFFRLNRL